MECEPQVDCGALSSCTFEALFVAGDMPKTTKTRDLQNCARATPGGLEHGKLSSHLEALRILYGAILRFI